MSKYIMAVAAALIMAVPARGGECVPEQEYADITWTTNTIDMSAIDVGGVWEYLPRSINVSNPGLLDDYTRTNCITEWAADGLLWPVLGGDTGIVCTVTERVETNTQTNAVIESTSYRALPCPDSKPGDMYSCLVLHAETVNVYSEIEKEVVTVIERIRSLRFEWAGETWTATKRTEIGRTVKRMQKREVWEVCE